MDVNPGFAARPRLQVVRPAPIVNHEVFARETLACIAEAPDGLPPADLVPRLADRLGIDADQIAEHDLDATLGVLVVTGRVDEVGGLLVALDQSSRATG
ncbi:MAG TPA: hypothetical protein PKE32_09350 [Miltoncostaeaceae bacterium]|nr:hypothetical protein [Miltoncostaeaceae bacterium]